MTADAAPAHDIRLTRNFRVSEFDCNDGTCVPAELLENLSALAAQLQIIRDHFDRPMKITSGYRSPSWNRRKRAQATSQHVLAKAADFRIRGISPEELRTAVYKLIRAGHLRDGGVGFYGTTTERLGWLHYDIGRVGRRWRG